MNRSDLKVIGGSTIAGILQGSDGRSLSPWASRHSVYLRLTDEGTAPQKENETLERGHALENVVAMMYAANHREHAVESIGMITHPDYPYAVGSPDRVLLDKDGLMVAGLEIKTANIITRDGWGAEDSDEIPVQYLCQCQWYSGLCGVPVWHLAVGFVQSNTRKIIAYREYTVNADPATFDGMLAAAVDFWTEHVEKRIPPEITEANAETFSYYRNKYPHHNPDRWLRTTDELDSLAEELIDSKKVLDDAEKSFELRKVKMIAALEDYEGYKSPFGKITYKTASPTSKTDWKAVANAVSAPPEIVNQFTQEVPGSRRFCLPR
jgi:putative phage-type endonuclease